MELEEVKLEWVDKYRPTKLDDYVLKSEYDTDKALTMASITWKDLG